MGNHPSDPHFAAIEETAAETDRLAELLKKFEATLNSLDGNVKVLVHDVADQDKKLDQIGLEVAQTSSDIAQIKDAMASLQQNIGGVLSLAKSALNEATKKRSVRPPRPRLVASNGGSK